MEDMEAMHLDGDEEVIEDEVESLALSRGDDESDCDGDGDGDDDNDHDDDRGAASSDGVPAAGKDTHATSAVDNKHTVLKDEQSVVDSLSSQLAGVRPSDADLLLELDEGSVVDASNDGDEEEIEDEWADAVEGGTDGGIASPN